jgi:beta-glucosidase
MVLLKNEKQVLPLDMNKYNALMVVGPNASSLDALAGNYHGMSSNMVTFAEGITAAAGPGKRVEYDQGCDFTDSLHFGGIWAASNCDVTIAVIGLTPVLEGEEGDAFLAPHGGDKADLNLPASQIAYIKALRKGVKDKPIIAVVTAGSAVDLSSIEPYVDAIILAWYPGEQGGNALADILTGKISPSGHLPVTFYRSLSDVPDYKSYSMAGRTYRYYTGPVQYPFGYGLSYTSFGYAWKRPLKETYSLKDTLSFSVEVSNLGPMGGDEVVQAYIQYPGLERMPLKELKAFQRVSVSANGSKEVDFSIPVGELQKWDLAKNGWKLYDGRYRIILGSHSRDEKIGGEFSVKN